MNTEAKRRSIRQFEASITLPAGCFRRGEGHIRFSYKMNDKYHYLTLTSPLEVAQLLKEHGIIKTYAVQGETVTMYQTTIVTSVGENGAPILNERLLPVKWQDIDFTESEIIHFAACNEYEKAMKQKSAIIRTLTDKLYKKAI